VIVVIFLTTLDNIRGDWKVDLLDSYWFDITFVVGEPSRFMHQPREVHWTVTFEDSCHFKSSPKKSLMYKKHENICIFCYSESGYAGDKGDKVHYWLLDIRWRKSGDNGGARRKMFLDPV